MYKNEWKKWIAITGRVLLAYALIFVQGGWAGQDPKAIEKPDLLQKAAVQQADEKRSSAAAPGESRATGRGSHEGIKVHGHWTIEVRNPDGTVVTHREFENSLVQVGGNFLVSLLARTYSVSNWQVTVYQSTTGAGPCTTTGATNSVQCVIAEPNVYAAQSNIFPNLTLRVSAPSGGGPSQFILSGTATAAVSSVIDTVGTALGYCSGTVAPSPQCSTGAGASQFTVASISPAVNVSGGQTIAVTVAITFS